MPLSLRTHGANSVVLNAGESRIRKTAQKQPAESGDETAATERRFSLGVLALAFILGAFVMTFSMRLQRRSAESELVHGFPETEVLVGIPHAWILGGKTGGGSGLRHEVNMSDLNQFPHLIEAFEEDARAIAVHADHATYCPAKEAMTIIEFFGEEYATGVGHYWYKLTAEDGSFYTVSIMFSWEPPIID